MNNNAGHWGPSRYFFVYCQLRKEQPVPKRETALFIILAFVILMVPACQRGPSDQELVEQGEEVYTVSCSRCHQPDGMGVDPVYPELAGNAFVTVREPHRVVDVVVTAGVVCLDLLIIYPGRRSPRLSPISALPGGIMLQLSRLDRWLRPINQIQFRSFHFSLFHYPEFSPARSGKASFLNREF
jgi:hypothetical protein